MQTALVVGGSGYVGRELCRQLAARGDDLTVLARSLQPAGLPGRWLQADVTDEASLYPALDSLTFDVIYHLASLPGDTGDPRQMIDVNIGGLTNMLVFARNTGAGRFVLSSSLSALEWYPGTPFNPPDYLPVDENHPARPKDMYSSTKYMQEILALTFCHQYRLPVAVLRLTAVVGPGGRGGGRSWLTFAEQLKAGRRVQIPHFTLDEICHYVDIRDAARMHIVAGQHPRAVGEVFNCAGPAPVSGADFVQLLKRIVPGIEVEVGFPWSMAQGGEMIIDMAKARRLLEFVPRYSLEDSIREIVQWIDAGGLEAGDQQAGSDTFQAGVAGG